jgi:glycosyltransferase involved in cell wall biosynthesis
MRPIVHAITPGDHFSPRTGSAIPTVVHGIARAAEAAGDARHGVLLDQQTFRPRYGSAWEIEYSGAPSPSRRARVVDAIGARIGMPRRSAIAAFAPLGVAMADQPSSFVLAHNAPALPRILRAQDHIPVLYAHNDILRTMGHPEAMRELRDVHAIVCVSNALADITRDRLPAALTGRVVVVENGVDTDTFRPAPQQTPHDRLRVMFLGRMIPDKGADVLVDAAKMLGRADIEFVLVGSAGFDRDAPLSAYEDALRKRSSGSHASVTFERFIARAGVPSLLHTADIFVVPSRWPDPSPLTVGEALASGLPVIGSRIGGIPEALGDAGILVTPGDPAELAAALEHLVTSPGERLRLAAAARRRAEERSWDATWQQLRTVLAELV